MAEMTVEEFVVDTYLTDPRGLMAWFHNQSVNDAADALDDLVRHRVRSAVEAQKEKDANEIAKLREALGKIDRQLHMVKQWQGTAREKIGAMPSFRVKKIDKIARAALGESSEQSEGGGDE